MLQPVLSCTNGFLFLLVAGIFSSCRMDAQYTSPPGYDFAKPLKKTLPSALHEISGIALVNEKADSIIAIEDEDGKIFSFSFNDNNTMHAKFGKKGDYEDLAILPDGNVVALRSDGSFFLFPAKGIRQKELENVQVFEHVLPEGEYEGLFADGNKLFTLCKNCPGDKQKKEVSVYTLVKMANDSLSIAGTFKIDLNILRQKEDNDVKFHPSGIAKNPVTQQWFIISSVNKLLLVLDKQWKAEKYYALDPALFEQPEGICFNSRGDLYISNEGGDGAANILLFPYQPN